MNQTIYNISISFFGLHLSQQGVPPETSVSGSSSRILGIENKMEMKKKRIKEWKESGGGDDGVESITNYVTSRYRTAREVIITDKGNVSVFE